MDLRKNKVLPHIMEMMDDNINKITSLSLISEKLKGKVVRGVFKLIWEEFNQIIEFVNTLDDKETFLVFNSPKWMALQVKYNIMYDILNFGVCTKSGLSSEIIAKTFNNRDWED